MTDLNSHGHTDRRTLLGGLAASAAVIASTPLTNPLYANTKKNPMPSNNIKLAFDPRSKLSAISSNSKQLWPVIYVERENTIATVEKDVAISFEGGADAVVLEIGKDPKPLEVAIAHVKKKFPKSKIGVNYLGGTDDPYGYLTGFKLAKEYELDIVWTDFCGVDLIKELPEISLHAIESQRVDSTFYCSGIHMKYGTLLNSKKSIEQSAYQAMGWVDGIIVTGPKTGVAADPERALRARLTIGQYPMGTASGISSENFSLVRDYVDFCLVNTSISDENHRIVLEKIKKLRKVMV